MHHSTTTEQTKPALIIFTLTFSLIFLTVLFSHFTSASAGAASAGKAGGAGGDWSVRASALLPLIVVSGFLDGIHPCGFAVLFFFIAFLFLLRRSRKTILLMGSLYIFGVFLAYFLIGFGILRALLLFSEPHFMAKAGAVLLVALGILSIANGVFPKTTFLKIPGFSKSFLEKWVTRATAPAAFVAGFLVGLCAFPCTGGIYLAILGIIAAKTAFLEGLAYLLLYNFMFVLPLIIILLLSSNKRVVNKMEELELAYKNKVKIITGLLLIALGLFILFSGVLS